MILAGDVGGTKTDLALYEPGASFRAPRYERRLASGEFPSLEALLRAFLADGPGLPRRAVIGIAGPVVGQRVEATNLPWSVAASDLSEELRGAHVTLLNDLEATGWGLGLLDGSEIETLQEGEPRLGNRALIAAGTGLGEAFLLRHGRGWLPSASEGGHVDFAPRDGLEGELLEWLRGRHGRVSYERVLSGHGIANLYRFFSATRRGAEPEGFAARFESAADPAALVSGAALDGSCERARLVMERFARIYGAEAGNLALKALAVGGVYVGGGIAPRIMPFLRGGSFVTAFTQKGRLSPLLMRMPVRVVLESRAALWGAAVLALTEEDAVL